MAAKILLVEDDLYLRQGVKDLLEREGYAVGTAASVREARALLLSGGWDLLALDVALPDGDGVALCRESREAGLRQPILFLTARDEEMDIVRGLDAGGNDYVTKPFRVQELLSRIRALLRKDAPGLRRQGTLEIDQERMQVKREGALLALTPTEYRILLTLMRRRGVTTRETLLEALWDDGSKFVDDNTLSVHVSRLREKIGAGHIRTVRGVGYQWEE